MGASSNVSFKVMAGIAGGAALLAGCKDTPGGTIPYNVSGFHAPDSTVSIAMDDAYRIAPMDVLTIRVFGMPDITGDYQVDLRGNIGMPLIGEVAAMDKSPAQLDSLLTARYSEKYLENPDISVGVKQASGHVLTVDGSVQKPGAYPVLGPTTLMQAIALAQGVDENANQHRVAIFRTIGGRREAAAFDLLSIRHGEMKDPQVYTGDIIIVDGSKNKEALNKFFKSIPLIAIFRPII